MICLKWLFRTISLRRTALPRWARETGGAAVWVTGTYEHAQYDLNPASAILAA
jgi:hypothetical protein